ncbi:MAG: CheR family methyltransferase [bacterium]
MTASLLEKWLAAAIGLDAKSLGPHAVDDAMKRRMSVCGLTEESGYLERLKTAPDELPALIELIVVPETWFFRDREPFVFLARHVVETWLAAHPVGLLRVLSVPCSSGEEPYSIAMTLQSAGIQSTRYRIDAVDINPVSLRKAETGAYGTNSFRSGLLANCERFFKSEGAVRIISPEARANIRFVQGNIMDPPRFAAEQTYDVVFCRNLLIYQQAEARVQIIDTLDRLLKPAGMLFVGHAEMITLLMKRYAPIRHSGSFAYCKIKGSPCNAALEPAVASSGGDQLPAAIAAAAITGKGAGVVLDVLQPAPGPAAGPLPATELRLDRVRGLADQGRLDEAAAICQELLREKPQSAEAYCLLGIIRAAAGQVQAAEECMNRALYLEADCCEALTHLSLLTARRGDKDGAERLRRHAERVRRDHAMVTT